MTADVEDAFRERADALAAQDWAVVAAQLHEDFVYTNSLGERLMKEGYLDFLRDGPLRWNRQWLEDAHVVEDYRDVIPRPGAGANRLRSS